jgi:hypothetical protein
MHSDGVCRCWDIAAPAIFIRAPRWLGLGNQAAVSPMNSLAADWSRLARTNVAERHHDRPKRTPMFEGFDFSVLNDTGFKEDSVREEIVAPILWRLGYQPSGRARVQRSKALSHPFVRIGVRKHPVNIIPDYTLLYDDKTILVIDAKRPSEEILRSHHVEQAYSYAIHPEVRCEHYALCNGKMLVLFAVREFEPLLVLLIPEIDRNWSQVERYLSPENLVDPMKRDFQPDFGLVVMKSGLRAEAEVVFPCCPLQLISKIGDGLFSASATCDVDTTPHLTTFDFDSDILQAIITCLPVRLRAEVEQALSRAPFHVQIDFMIETDLITRLGPLTRGADDSNIPFIVTRVTGARFNTAPHEEANDVPAYVFRLRPAFHRLLDSDDGS